ncbi:hypothetical protein LAZ67_19000390 [Cordylochernes scorpioides]|uniref:Uncharacterized protein n=1 Tax=Cordylochernes scorpioides TaxID=51811 RepID=A0ABY6LIN5_9ARAC|nr:hypothetical protein LAZ67_19000390 [Cordylochernes scorpioides]
MCSSESSEEIAQDFTMENSVTNRVSYVLVKRKTKKNVDQ